MTSANSNLAWRCRRGSRELDLLLHAYWREGFWKAPEEERAAFERLLECRDEELRAWFFLRDLPRDPALAALIDKIHALRAIVA